jgi:serine/threonine protein kinase
MMASGPDGAPKFLRTESGNFFEMGQSKGKGAFGEVRAATNLRTGENIAIKTTKDSAETTREQGTNN